MSLQDHDCLMWELEDILKRSFVSIQGFTVVVGGIEWNARIKYEKAHLHLKDDYDLLLVESKEIPESKAREPERPRKRKKEIQPKLF